MVFETDSTLLYPSVLQTSLYKIDTITYIYIIFLNPGVTLGEKGLNLTIESV